MKKNVTKPEKHDDSAFLQENVPVTHAAQKLADNLRNHKIRRDTARHAKKGEEYAYEVLPFFVARKIENPAQKAFFRGVFTFLWHINLLFSQQEGTSGMRKFSYAVVKFFATR